MRNGFKVYDSDTHVTASAEELEPYLASSVKALVPELEKYKTPMRRTSAGAVLEPPYSHRYSLGAPEAVGDQTHPEPLAKPLLSPMRNGGLRSSWVPSYPLPTANGSPRAG